MFPVGGRYLFSEMDPVSRFLVKFGASLTKDPEVKKGMLTECDDVRRENLSELFAWLKVGDSGK